MGKVLLLGLCNIGLLFPLLLLSAYHLLGGLASTLQAASPLVVMGLAWLLLREQPGRTRVLAAVVGLAGVALLVRRSPGGADSLGLAGQPAVARALRRRAAVGAASPVRVGEQSSA